MKKSSPKNLRLAPIACAFAMLATGTASAAVTSVDLSNYSLIGTFALPPVEAMEASAITYNPDTDTLFLLGDEGPASALAEVTKTGVLVSTMTTTNFGDTEGLTYIGGGQFVLAEERLQALYKFTYSAGGLLDRNALQSADLGANIGNLGIEGVSFDPRDGTFVTVKETGPQEIKRHTINFGTGTVSSTSIFNPAGLGVLDLSDVQVLATVPSLLGTPDEGNLLIFSQESAKLLKVSAAGTVLGAFDFAGLASNAEGVTIDTDGFIYVVGETPTLYVLAPPVPLPAAVWLLGSGLLGLAGIARRRRAATLAG